MCYSCTQVLGHTGARLKFGGSSYFTPWEAERAASAHALEGPTVGTVGRKLDGVFRRRPARLEVARLCGEACASRQAFL